MAVTTYTGQPDANINFQLIKWLAVPNGNTGTPWNGCDFQDRSVQITGTFGAGGSVSIKGSNDGGTTWVILSDPLGNALTFTSGGMKQITEIPYQIRPEVTAGDGTTALNIYLFARGDFR